MSAIRADCSRRHGRAGAGLLVALAAIAMVTAACVGHTAPARASVQQLAQNSDSFEGELVMASGFVHAFDQGQPQQYFVLESGDGQFRVALMDADPDRLASLIDRPITVTGRFHFRPDFGDTIEVSSIAVGLV